MTRRPRKIVSLVCAFFMAAGCSVSNIRPNAGEDSANWKIPLKIIGIMPTAANDCLPVQRYIHDKNLQHYSARQKTLASGLDRIAADPTGKSDLEIAARNKIIVCNDIERRETTLEKDGKTIVEETDYGRTRRDWEGGYTDYNGMIALNIGYAEGMEPNLILTLRHETRHVGQYDTLKKLFPAFNSSADLGSVMAYARWIEADGAASAASFAWRQKIEQGKDDLWDTLCKSPARYKRVCAETNAALKRGVITPAHTVHAKSFSYWLLNKPDVDSYTKDVIMRRLFAISGIFSTEKDMADRLDRLAKLTPPIANEALDEFQMRVRNYLEFMETSIISPAGYLTPEKLTALVRPTLPFEDWTTLDLLLYRRYVLKHTPDFLNQNLPVSGLSQKRLYISKQLTADLEKAAILRKSNLDRISRIAELYKIKLSTSSASINASVSSPTKPPSPS